MANDRPSFSSTELFTFSRLEPVRVIDVEHRAGRYGVPEGAEQSLTWSRQVMAGPDIVDSFDDLSFDYAAYLKDGHQGAGHLPQRGDLREAERFDGAAIVASPDYQDDLRRVNQTFLARTIDEHSDQEARQSAARLLQFVESFPRTAQAHARRFYAPILSRREPPPPPPELPEEKRATSEADRGPAGELAETAGLLRQVWSLRDEHLTRMRSQYLELKSLKTDLVGDALTTATPAAAPPKPAKGKKSAAMKATARPPRQAKISAQATARRMVASRIEDARKAYASAKRQSSLGMILADPKRIGGGSSGGVANAGNAAVDRLKDLIAKNNLPADSFCQLYALLLEQLDQLDRAVVQTPVNGGDGEVWDAPGVSFADSVRMLGKAELVRVEEEFVSYSPAEISYVQTVLPGERRVRKTRSANLQEQLLEQVEDELTERLDETSASTKSELKSEIETELKSRFDSNVSASGSGSGGGSVGLVNFSGSGSVSAGLGLGVDTGVSTRNEGQFTQEIVRKAVERTNRRTMERRLTRSRQSYSASDLHEITNDTAQPINGTYVFLNKHVAVTETVFGVRAFMEAKILAPGRSLVAARRFQQRAIVDEVGDRPRFDISPADITPANYLEVAGRYRASNVEPPPPPVTRLTRVYKTDSAAATGAQDSFNGRKIADVLVPFYGRYQRFAITDNVDLPDGYAVLDVDVAVSHGANGVSLPAHLPLTLPGTAFYAGVSFMPFAMGLLGIAFLPAWVWSVAFMSSPILHFNTDSSNVTVTIGTEGQDSAFYFFEPDDLLDAVMELMNAISAASPRVLQRLQSLALDRVQDIQDAAARVPEEIATRVKDSIDGAVTKIKTVLDKLAHADLGGALAELGNVSGANLSLANLPEMTAVFTPVRSLISDLSDLLQDEVGDAIQLALGRLLSRMENNQRLDFGASRGLQSKLPIAINAVALQPGVTVTVSACLERTANALAQWQLRTFESCYQAYLQQVAAYESQSYSATPQHGRSPANMRRDERLALKERVINALHALHSAPGGTIPIERLELFEHAIDWDSMTVRLFNYGPSESAMALEKLAIVSGSDEERRQFLLASWAQVMIPLQPHDGLIGQFLDYLSGGGGRVSDALLDTGGEVPDLDELTALYRDLVLSRSLIGDDPPPGEARFVTLPTDLVALFEPNLAANLPRNPAWP